MASKDGLEDLDLKPDEIKRITDALKDEKFRKLFVEYAEEIADPENRRLYEEEIRQMENERGMDIQFIHPTPGHVIKTTVNGSTIAFINICKNEKIEKPSFESKVGPDNRSGMFCQIPHSFAPEREDIDDGNKCIVYDFVIHPDTYRMSETNERYQKMIYDVAFDGIEQKFNAKIDRNNFKKIKLEFKGIPQATVIRTRRTESKSEESKPEDEMLKNMPYPYDQKTTVEKTRELEQEMKKRKEEKHKKDAKVKKGKVKEDNDATTPRYTITHRSEMDLQEYCNRPDSRPSTRPKVLVIKIDLPLLSSAAPVSLDIFEQRLVLECVKPAKYKLDIRLPYPVNDDEGSAKFDKVKHCLVITLPVIPDVIPKLPSFIEDEPRHNGDVNDTNDELPSSKGDKPLIEELPPSSDTQKKNNGEPNEIATQDTSTDEISHEKEKQIAYSLPDYDFSQDNDTVSFVFNVKNVTPESVTKSFPSQNSVTLKFMSVGSGYFPMHYSIHLNFGTGHDVVAEEVSVETSENNAVLLLLKARNSRGIWDHFEVGIDADHLEEKLFLTEDNLQDELDMMDKEAEERQKLMPSEESQLQVQVTEMNERKLTVQIKSEGILEDADNDEFDPPSSADIEVIYNSTGPKLQSILKQRTMSESSDDYGTNGDSSKSCPEEEFSSSLNGRFRKSVSFNNHIDKTTYKPSASPTSMKTALKSKRRRARKKDEKINKKAGRRRHNSGGSEGSSGDDFSSEHTNSDSQSEDKNDEFEQIAEEGLEAQEADGLTNKDKSDFRTRAEQIVCASNVVNEQKNGDAIETIVTPEEKMDSDDDNDNLDVRTTQSKPEVQSRKDDKMYAGGDRELDNAHIKSRSKPVIDAQVVSSEDVSDPGSLKKLIEEDGSCLIRINADYSNRTDQQICDNRQPAHKQQNGENNNDKPADDDDGVQTDLSWKETKMPDVDNEHRTQCAFKFSNSLIYDLDVD